MKHTIIFTTTLLLSLGLLAQPTISSFSPAFGSIGTTVTINGTNFSTNPSANIVFFGSVKGNVSSANSTSLTVAVPVGATYQPINVTVGGLTGYSSLPFVVTFSGGGTINKNSFAPNVDSSTGSGPYCIATADMDGDGNPDLLTTNKDSNSVSVLRNTTTNGSISFAFKVDLSCTKEPFGISICDLDNDGKKDIAVATFNGFSIFRNTNIMGTLSFAPRIDYPINPRGMRDIVSADFDGDGKTDIAIADDQTVGSVYGIISVYRNTSTSSNISFDPKTNFSSNTPTGFSGVLCLKAADLDGDQRTDLAFTFNWPYFSSLRNTSSLGNISFRNTSGEIPLPSRCIPLGLAVGDMNGDDKPDIIVADHYTDSISIIKNISTPGIVSFASRKVNKELIVNIEF